MKKNTLTKITAILVLFGLIIGSISTAILTMVGSDTGTTKSEQITQEQLKSLIEKSNSLSGNNMPPLSASGNIQ